MDEKSQGSGRNSANSRSGRQSRGLVMAGDSIIHGATGAASPHMQQQEQLTTVDHMKMTHKSENETAS